MIDMNNTDYKCTIGVCPFAPGGEEVSWAFGARVMQLAKSYHDKNHVSAQDTFDRPMTNDEKEIAQGLDKLFEDSGQDPDS